MAAPILATKLYIPPVRPNLVQRDRLMYRLDQGLSGKLTLISAPAGFGKTTLISGWLADQQQSVAWLSLDEDDDDLTHFATYLVSALQSVVPSIGQDALMLLQSSQSPPIETVLATLINEISADITAQTLLVLDDYHVLNSPAIDQVLSFLLDHLPPQLHVVITTREDPNLPLARYRARHQLTEIRAVDLRFTPVEAAQFLEHVMGLALTAEEVMALEKRTEGWIAGLQMAALSMQGRDDPAGFIDAFTGSHRFVADYLVEEVLHNQPQPIRDFLLQTSILEQLCASLCHAVTERNDSQEMLANLDRQNLFLIPLDDQRHWYRYHHLFAEVLQARAQAELPVQMAILHRRASLWYEASEQRFPAIRHALAAEDFDRAATLIELARPFLETGRRDTIFRGWVEALPDALSRLRPVLNVGYALALIDAGELADAEPRLHEVEAWLDDPEREALVVVDDAQLRALPASIATAKVYYSLARGHVQDTLVNAQAALKELPEDDYLRRSHVTGLLGLAYWAIGKLEEAQQALLAAGTFTQKAGSILDTIPGTFVMADIYQVRGQLRNAAKQYAEALQIVEEHAATTHLGLENIYAGLGDLHREWGDLAAAADALTKSKTLGERYGENVWRYRWSLAQARLKIALGDLDEAVELLNRAEQLHFLNPLPEAKQASALKTRSWLMQNRLDAAMGWVREQGLSVDDELNYAREFEHITLARVLLAQFQQRKTPQSADEELIQDALKLINRLLAAAEAGGRWTHAIEILVLLALAHSARGDISSALGPLEKSLVVAEPEGYVRIFVDEGAPMRDLLQQAAAKNIMPAYVRKLLDAFENVDPPPLQTTPPRQAAEAVSMLHTTSAATPVEALSQRELDVLRLLCTELSGPEIADQLSVALSTVRTHTKSIYGKLSVNNRRAAVNRAKELNLI